ncbi:hypothetical protein K435DRAFT_706920 [Dendrothele bispora CBS 962.96]|uniref:DUF6593 domain-containing protein n=1 Tax=Dendrothele bispora (strain CBS 962.96) TaxID=1314807 RepID=A0A4S8KJ98_DENBC|nr:hypothetical protein K435DRAFT_706920 [Dendrothele bispora CBS 962.96]
MHCTNPYAQSGWTNSSFPQACSELSGLQPSVYGALPFTSVSGDTPTFYRFCFISDGCNFTVVDPPKSKTYFWIMDNTPTTGFMLFQNRDRKIFAVIEWRLSPGTVVEVRDVVKKQLVSSWLALSQDRSYRHMTIGGRSFVWVPRDDYIGLYSHGIANPELYAKVTKVDPSQVVLDITSAAIRLGLLDPCVVAVVLLQSGRHID